MTHRLESLVGPALLSLSCCVAWPAQAEALRLQTSGTFTLQTPVTSFSAPGADWSLSFVVDSHPELSPDHDMVREGINTTPIFRDFRYTLNGVEQPQASYATFYSEAEYGGMDLIFGPIVVGLPYGYDALVFRGRPFYSGSEVAPTIEPGDYLTTLFDESGLYVATLGVFHEQPAALVTISPVPLPPSAAMMLAGLALLAGLSASRSSRSRRCCWPGSRPQPSC